LGSRIGQAIDMPEQHLQIVWAELFQQAPIALLRPATIASCAARPALVR
jgi:hypothetical protein